MYSIVGGIFRLFIYLFIFLSRIILCIFSTDVLAIFAVLPKYLVFAWETLHGDTMRKLEEVEGSHLTSTETEITYVISSLMEHKYPNGFLLNLRKKAEIMLVRSCVCASMYVCLCVFLCGYRLMKISFFSKDWGILFYSIILLAIVWEFWRNIPLSWKGKVNILSVHH